MLGAAINFGVTPVEIREIVYQATAYLGIGRVFPFLKVMNKVFTEKGIKLPLENQATTTTENPRIHGTDKTRIAIRLQITDFLLLHPVSSIAKVMIFLMQ